jgi:hypothetical protein
MAEQKQSERQDERGRAKRRREERWEEKEEKEEKGREEKWRRRDPVASVTWAVVLIWIGVVLLAGNLNVIKGFGWWNTWALCFAGAGVIVLVQAIVRLAMPGYRWGVIGGFILGFILLGIGLGGMIGWGVFLPLLLIALGLLVLWRAFARRRR